MSEPTYIYRVSFKNEPAGDNVWITDHFFGSLSAIYDTFTAEQIGCGVNRLWNIGFAKGNAYKSKKCTITKEPFLRMKHKSSPISDDNLANENKSKR